mgnify:CR=1 FL=1
MWYKVKKIYQWSNLVRPKWKPWANTIAYYPLKENANDYSWNSRNLTNSWITFGENNWVDCGYFSGSACAYLSSSLFTWNPSFTVSFYAKMISADRYYWRSYWFVGTGNSNYSFWNFVQSSTNWSKLSVWWWSNDKVTTYTVDNNWHHIVFTYSSWSWTVYVDGTSVYTGTRSPNIQDYRTVIWANPNLADGFYGYMNEFIFEDKVRTTTEISNYYNNTKANYWL